jgi:lipoate-protein ligase A
VGSNSLISWESWVAHPFQDLAREELLLRAAEAGRPHLFAYAWPSPALVLGYGQDLRGGVDLPACERLGIPVLRRASGGTGVLHHASLSLSLALPAAHPWARGIGSLYDGFVEALRSAVASLGIPCDRARALAPRPRGRSPICFEDQRTESLLLGGRKVLGCAQIRRTSSVLVHGTLLLGLDVPLQAAVFGVQPERIAAAMTALPPPAPAAPALARICARSLARALGVALEDAAAPPGLPESLAARRTDPRWVLLG